jgi:hypothetical protein
MLACASPPGWFVVLLGITYLRLAADEREKGDYAPEKINSYMVDA